MSPQPNKPGRCRAEACRAVIRWVVMESGKRNPLDPDPNPEGNVVVPEDGSPAFVLKGSALDLRRAAGEDLYISHFATCPENQRFRRARQEPLL